MKISKQTFIECINNIKKQYERDSIFSDAVNNYFDQDLDNSLPRNYILDSLVKILQQHFNDENAHSWIEYYLWELEFGTKDGNVKIENKPFELKTPEQLYNLLITLKLKNHKAQNTIKIIVYKSLREF